MDIVMCSIDRNLVIHLVKVEAQNPIVAESETHPQSPSFFFLRVSPSSRDICPFSADPAVLVVESDPWQGLLSRGSGGRRGARREDGLRSLGQMDRRSIGF